MNSVLLVTFACWFSIFRLSHTLTIIMIGIEKHLKGHNVFCLRNFHGREWLRIVTYMPISLELEWVKGYGCQMIYRIELWMISSHTKLRKLRYYVALPSWGLCRCEFSRQFKTKSRFHNLKGNVEVTLSQYCYAYICNVIINMMNNLKNTFKF